MNQRGSAGDPVTIQVFVFAAVVMVISKITLLVSHLQPAFDRSPSPYT
jgi:hypothetical protein